MDCYVLRHLAGAKRIRITVSRKKRMGDLFLEVYDRKRKMIPGSRESDDEKLVFSSWSVKGSNALYIRVKPGTHVAYYDLHVEVGR